MAIKQILEKHWEGESSDDKPTGVISGSTFRETDTRALYITHDGDNWVVADKRTRLVREDGTFVKSFERHITIEYPFGKDKVRSTGIQYSDEVVTTAQDWKTVESVTIEPPVGGTIVELEVGITFSMKSSGAAKYVRGRVRVRNKDGTWVVICADGTSPAAGNAYIEKAASAAAYTEYTFSGRIETEANLNAVPLDIEVQVYPEAHVTETATGKVKNSSYVRIVYDE